MTATLSPEKYDDVTEALKDVMDPELGINVVDLGLIYDLSWDEENDALVIHMTLTSAGCPLTDVLEEQTAQARRRRRSLPHQLGVDAAVGPRAHHRRRTRHDARARFRHLTSARRRRGGGAQRR
jgi:metal-sulfur cluster biosynthetic enzyme